jgi:hypothetical protein
MQQAWGASHCVTNCHDEVTQEHIEKTTPKNTPQEKNQDSTPRHSHHCLHSFTVAISFTTLQVPTEELKPFVYHFALYQSEPHLQAFIEPPILS